jgi:hypothetical protein
MQKLSDHIVLSIKDQIRSARYHIRRSARGQDVSGTERGLFQISRPMASFADSMLSEVAAAATTILADESESFAQRAFPLPIETYFGHPDDEATRARDFMRVFYNALKAMLRKFGAREFLIFEHAIDDARAELLLRHNDLVWAVIKSKRAPLDAARAERTTRLCAAMTFHLASCRPIKELDIDPADKAAPKHLLLSPNIYCLCVMGLATAIVSLSPEAEKLDRKAIVAAADLAVDARFSRFAAAFHDRDPIGALTTLFSAVLPFLP